MLLFTYGPISFEPMGIIGFSFRLTSPKNKWDQQKKKKKDLEEVLYVPFNIIYLTKRGEILNSVCTRRMHLIYNNNYDVNVL